MKKNLTVEIASEFVLKHRDDDELPVAALQKALEAVVGLDVVDSTLDTLDATFDEEEITGDALERVVEDIFADLYPRVKLRGVLTVRIGDAEDGQVEAEDSRQEETEEAVQAQAETVETTDETESKRAKRKAELDKEKKERAERESKRAQDKIAEVQGRIAALVGATELKALADEIAAVAPEIVRTKTYEIFSGQSYLFSIGDGCGLSTYLELLTDLISATGIAKVSWHQAVRELKLPPAKEGTEPFEDVERIVDNGNDDDVQVLCIDISEWMSKTETHAFKQFLRKLEKSTEQFIFVFRVPFVEKDVLEQLRFSLNDLMRVRALSFPPLKNEEIDDCAANELSKYGFSADAGAWSAFRDRITEEKSDGKFYGLNTVKKVVHELVYLKQLKNAREQKTSNEITGKDAAGLCLKANDGGESGFALLDRLVGSAPIKKRIEEIVAHIELSLKKGGERPCIHMRFVGNPGTGKTTVARILGKILKEKGVLRIGNFFEYAGRDFCGRYVGETAPKTASMCRDAYGSVLFIDEAYALYRGFGNADYGREAIDTLIAEMENHRNDFVVIMAGYTDDMKTLMEANAGLASRMPYILEFPNFTREQLYEVFVSMVGKSFKTDDRIFETAKAYFDGLPKETIEAKEFPNARFVRNLFERTWAKAAMRTQLAGDDDVILKKEDFLLACADKEFDLKPKKMRLGF